jgi:osmoprotectant transport system substrate-binding protein
MDLGLLYRALAAHQVDMIAANSTDGPIKELRPGGARGRPALLSAVPGGAAGAGGGVERWPQMQTALDALAGKVTADDMRAMNEAIDGQHRDPAEVVREFRNRNG